MRSEQERSMRNSFSPDALILSIYGVTVDLTTQLGDDKLLTQYPSSPSSAGPNEGAIRDEIKYLTSRKTHKHGPAPSDKTFTNLGGEQPVSLDTHIYTSVHESPHVTHTQPNLFKQVIYCFVAS